MNCECKDDGYCHRYKRHMNNRQRFLCQSSGKHRELFERIAESEQTVDSWPSLLSRAISFGLFIVRWFANSFARVEPRISEHRLRICRGDGELGPCPQYDRGWCRSCGCWLNLKVIAPFSHCPKMKWPAIEQGPIGSVIMRTIDRLAGKRSCACGAKSQAQSLPIIDPPQ